MLTYFNAAVRVLKLDETIYPELVEKKRTTRYSFINVIILGIVYGLSAIFFNQEFFDVFSQGASLMISQGIVLFIGIVVAFFLHLGAGLLIWVFLRGVGAKINFFIVYLNVGVSVVPLWLAMPGLAAIQAGIVTPIALLYAAFTGVYALLSIFTAAKSSSGLSFLRVSLAMTITIIFITCFLYLWVV
ncbi:MAG TPA: hypothetical protein VFD15_05675 [Clostridia bacterium]|nr:hypothetical protein [Clostridia bacterium]